MLTSIVVVLFAVWVAVSIVALCVQILMAVLYHHPAVRSRKYSRSRKDEIV